MFDTDDRTDQLEDLIFILFRVKQLFEKCSDDQSKTFTVNVKSCSLSSAHFG